MVRCGLRLAIPHLFSFFYRLITFVLITSVILGGHPRLSQLAREVHLVLDLDSFLEPFYDTGVVEQTSLAVALNDLVVARRLCEGPRLQT